MGTSSSVPLVELTDKEKKKCAQISLGSPPDRTLKGLRKLGVEVVAAEYVVHVCPEEVAAAPGGSDPKGSNPPPDAAQAAAAAAASVVASSVVAGEGGSVQDDGTPLVHRVPRAAILTRGTVHIEVKKRLRKKKDQRPNVLFAVRDLQTVRCDGFGDLVVLASWNAKGDLDFAMYQTPDPGRFLRPLAETLAAGHAGVPTWAVPVQWKVALDLPRVSSDHRTLLGSDGGFSSSFYSAALATLIKANKWNIGPQLSKGGPSHISSLIEEQQPQHARPLVPHASNASPKCLDVIGLVESLPGGQPKPGSVRSDLVLDALSCLPFNLVFRKLSIRNLHENAADETWPSRFGRDLSRVLLYNVTLREVDLSGTALTGLGETLGQALAMNIQPLISRLDVSDCRLTDRDLRGFIPGLARLWCGGSAWPESVVLADNPSVGPSSWNVLFDVLTDPSTFPFWPKSPPPPPNLAYLQRLDVRGTTAAGAGLARLIPRLSGLRSVGVGSSRGSDMSSIGGGGEAAEATGGMLLVLRALEESSAPLESFFGEGVDGSCAAALFRHRDTLRDVTLIDYRGDAGPLLGSWPESVPKLTVEFKGKCTGAYVNVPDGEGYAPATLVLRSDIINGQAVKLLSSRATGLKSLYIYGMHYAELADAVPLLACSGLVDLHVHPSGGGGGQPQWSRTAALSFWNALSASKSLEDLQLPDQLSSTVGGELVMIGAFLKSNRSVRRINFDSVNFSLDVEGVKALRSAFYGNKKVIHMKSLDAARARTVEECRQITQHKLREVQECKAQIKRIFKSHYSKYNSNWRDKPNRLKLPYVERIRQAKRKIGQIERDMAKISRLLEEIRMCIASNRRDYNHIQEEKEKVKLERREGQLENIAVKKKKIMTQLVTKLHKAKQRGRKGKSGKTQVPRSAYYKDKRMWPSASAGGGKNKSRSGPSSHYHYWNDPYGARYHWGYGYYSYGYYDCRHQYLCDPHCHDLHHFPHCHDLHHFPPVPEEEQANAAPPEDGSQQPGNEESGEREIPGDGGSEGGGAPPDEGDGAPPPPPPLMIVDNDVVAWENLPDGESSTGAPNNAWEDIAPTGDPAELAAPSDPWDGMDGLVRELDANAAVTLTPEFLSDLHTEAAELGPDVVADLAPVLDAGAAVDAKIDGMADSMAVDRALLDGTINSNVDEGFDVGALESELGDIGDYEYEMEADADDVVEMYAGAGPRDLDDGGPSFGGSGNAALAGARRRARTRKSNRVQRRVRSSVASRCSIGYKSLSFPDVVPRRGEGMDSSFASWHDNLAGTLVQDVTAAQIDAISKSDFFTLPDVANAKMERIFEWTKSSNSDLATEEPIEVILVTQCSLDRLQNLQEQLVAWKGKASVAVYAKHNANMVDAKKQIVSHIGEAKRRALGSSGGAPRWDIAATVVEDINDDAPYPINFLRNLALLEARYQQLRTRGASDKCAALLVDVDFRPSNNLHSSLHCEAAADAILERQNVVVCPAFECASDLANEGWPRTISQLKECVDDGRAEGFHLSHFPQGHGPTRFDTFWKRSLAASSGDGVWEAAYHVPYQTCFEPYVVMAIDNVPLADERFQGYGLNKVSHLASIARHASSRNFLVLPGVFLAAPAHERSESWSQVYDSTSDEAKFNKLVLKGLYQNFCLRLDEGRDPVVSRRTKEMNTEIADEAKNFSRITEGERQTKHCDPLVPTSAEEELLLSVLSSLLEQHVTASTEKMSLLRDPCGEETIKITAEICLVQS